MKELLCNYCGYEWISHYIDICLKCESNHVQEAYNEEEEDSM